MSSSYSGTDLTAADNENSLCEECHSKKLSEHNAAALVYIRRTQYVSILLSVLAIILSAAAISLFLVSRSCSECPKAEVDPLRTGTASHLTSHPGNKRSPLRTGEETPLSSGNKTQRLISRLFRENKRDVQPSTLNLRRKKNSKGKSRKGRRQKSWVTSAHFIPKPIDDEPFGADRCKHYSDIRVCMNNTAIMLKQESQLRDGFWVPWNSTDKRAKKGQKIAVQLVNGLKAKIVKTGVYFIYAQAMFLKTVYRDSIHVKLLPDILLMSCVEGKNESEYQTCSVNGVFYLQKGSEIEINFPYSNTQVNLRSSATFFGLVNLK